VFVHDAGHYILLQVEGKMKYAKWKAVEIDKCLKNGITPTPGPPDSAAADDEGAVGYYPMPSGPGDGSTSYSQQDSKPVPKPRHNISQDPPDTYPPYPQQLPPLAQDVNPRHNISQNPPDSYPPYPQQLPPLASSGPAAASSSASAGGVAPNPTVGPDIVAEAQKKCKFASSSLDYEDVTGAIDYLREALELLTTGRRLK
jgi:vacuolar protein sorting-associated protein VTA1